MPLHLNGGVLGHANYMEKIQLTKREYLGEGYIFEFVNNLTKERLIVPCTKEDYISITENSDNNPVMEGYTFIGGCGGTIKVDTQNSTLGAYDYTQIADSYRVGIRNKEVAITDINNNEIDSALWEECNKIFI